MGPAEPGARFLVRELPGGVRLLHAPSAKFKTVAMRAYLHAPLAAETVTATALVPHVLARGTRALPTLGDLARRTEELFGAGLGAGAVKLGESQSVYVAMDAVLDRYLPEGAAAVAGALDLTRALLLDPARDGAGLLRADVLAQEKENLRRRIAALINDKIRYASLRCIEAMCRGEPYALHAYGRAEDLPAIDGAAVSARYAELLAHAPVDLFAVGGPLDLAEQLAAAFGLARDRDAVWPRPTTPTAAARRSPQVVTETQPVDQGKLCLGYRAPVTYGDPRHAAMVMYSGILGGFPHSKLFRNVREKASLAYYASSRYDAHKGIVLVAAGIEPDNYERARDIIAAQVADMAAGRISDDELDATRSGLRNHLRSAEDAPGAAIDLALAEAMTGAPRSLGERLADLEAVTREQVVEVADQVSLDTIYFLRSGPGAPAPQDGTTGPTGA